MKKRPPTEAAKTRLRALMAGGARGSRRAERVRVVVEGRLPFDPIDIGSPRSQVDLATALRAERALRILGPPDNFLGAGGTFDNAGGLGGFAHRLQKVILKNNISYCFL